MHEVSTVLLNYWNHGVHNSIYVLLRQRIWYHSRILGEGLSFLKRLNARGFLYLMTNLSSFEDAHFLTFCKTVDVHAASRPQNLKLTMADCRHQCNHTISDRPKEEQLKSIHHKLIQHSTWEEKHNFPFLSGKSSFLLGTWNYLCSASMEAYKHLQTWHWRPWRLTNRVFPYSFPFLAPLCCVNWAGTTALG